MMNWMINWNSESDRWAEIGDLSTVIGDRGALYPCPNISAVDKHIGRLYKRIEETAPWLPELVQELWADIDLLLDRRMWLALEREVSGAA